MTACPQMNKEPEFLAAKLRRVHDLHVRPLNELVERRRREGRQAPYADPDSGGIRSRICSCTSRPARRHRMGMAAG
jgi:hypothetical protein